MKPLLTLISLISALSLYSQDYSKRFEHSSAPIIAKAISSNDKYNTLIAGNYDYTDGGFLTNIDESGVILWQKWIDWQTDSLYNAQFYEIVPTMDSAFLITAGGRKISPATRYLCVVLKVDTFGNLMWQKRFESQDSECFYAAATEQSDSTYWISWGGIFSGQSNSVVHLSTNGDVINSASYYYGFPSHVASINSLSDSSLIIAGRLDDPSFARGYLSKIDTNGIMIWTKSYDSLRFEDIIVRNNKIYGVAYNEPNNMARLMSFDTSGTMITNTRLASGSADILTDKAQIIELQDSTLVTVFQSYEWYPRIFHVDTTGALIESFMMEGKNGLTMPNSTGGATFVTNGPLYGIKNLWDEHFAVVRLDSALYTRECFQSNFPNTFSYPIQLGDNFNVNNISPPVEIQGPFNTPVYNATTTQSDGCALFIGNVKELSEEYVTVYPNVSDGSFNFDLAIDELVEIRVYSALGILVYEEIDVFQNTSIDLSEFANGSYYYQATVDGVSNNGVLILQK